MKDNNSGKNTQDNFQKPLECGFQLNQYLEILVSNAKYEEKKKLDNDLSFNFKKLEKEQQIKLK